MPSLVPGLREVQALQLTVHALQATEADGSCHPCSLSLVPRLLALTAYLLF